MADQVFNKILGDAVRSGVIPDRSRKSIEWLRNRAKNTHLNNRDLLNEGSRLRNKVDVGSMYMFKYDPKFGKELPYYDAFPLIFPFAAVPGGFYGINMHYLPYNYRAKLMDALYDITNNSRFDKTTKLRLSYNLLSNTAKYKYFKPCVKHYLNDHVRSPFIYVYPAEWDMALFLPTEQFKKADRKTVWRDSRNMI